MKLISPYTYDDLKDIDTVFITEKDITEFLKEVPEGSIRCNELTWESASQFIARFRETNVTHYRFKTVIFCIRNTPLVFFNQTYMQEVDCTTLQFKVNISLLESTNRTYTATLSILGYTNLSNKYYKPAERLANIDTEQKAIQLNGNAIYTGFVVHKNIPYTDIILNLSLGAGNKKLILIPTFIGNLPALGLINGVTSILTTWINLNNKRCFGDYRVKGYQYHHYAVSRGFFADGKDLYTRINASIPETQRFLYTVNADQEIMFLDHEESFILGQSYNIIQKSYGEDLFDSNHVRILFKEFLVLINTSNYTGMIYNLKSGQTRYIKFPDGEFYLVADEDTPVVFVQKYSSDKNNITTIASNCWIDGNDVIRSRNELQFSMFNCKYTLRNKNLITKIDE